MSQSIAIHHPDDPTRPNMIPADMYNPAVHTLWDENAPVVDLPQDIPGRKALIAAGLTTMAKVRAVTDFDELPGIGQITEELLVRYLYPELEGVDDEDEEDDEPETWAPDDDEPEEDDEA